RRTDVAPARPHHADHDAILVHQGDQRAAAEAGAAAVLFAQAVLPDRLARAVEGDQLPVHVLRVDGARLRVRGQGGPTYAAERHRRVVDAEAALPQLAAGGGVEAGHQLVGRGAGARPASPSRRTAARGERIRRMLSARRARDKSKVVNHGPGRLYTRRWTVQT